jgi:hypothetical protein
VTLAAAASPVPLIGYSQAGIVFLTPEHRTVRLWSPDAKALQCAQAWSSSNRTDVMLLMLDTVELTDWLARYSLADGSLVAAPLQVHNNVPADADLGSQPTQRMALVGNGATTLLYSPAGKNLLRYQTDSQLFEGVVRMGSLDALLSARLRSSGPEEMVWLAADGWVSAYPVLAGAVSFGAQPTWRRAVPGRVKYMVYEADESLLLRIAVVQINGELELWQMDALSGQNLASLQQVSCGCALTSAQVGQYAFSVQSISQLAQVNLQWPSLSTDGAEVQELPVSMRGSFLLPLNNNNNNGSTRQWYVLGGDPQTLAYAGDGKWTTVPTFDRYALKSSLPLVALGQQGNVRRLDNSRVALLDWSRLLLTQQGRTLSVYSLDSARYLGYWDIKYGLDLLDGYNRHALLGQPDGTQLGFLTDSYRFSWVTASIGTSTAALNQPLVSSILCGTYRACNLYANGAVEIYYELESEDNSDRRGKVVVLASQGVAQLGNPRRLLFDEKHDAIVLVATTEGALHISRVMLPPRYDSKVGKKSLFWGPVQSLALSVGASLPLPPMDVTTADGELMVLGNGTTVHREHYGHAAWTHSEESTMAQQPQWRFLRAKYYRYDDGRDINTILAGIVVGVFFVCMCLPLSLMLCCCLFKVCGNGTCRPMVYRSFQPLDSMDTRFYWLLNPLRKLLSFCCCCTSERMQFRVDSCLLPNDGSRRAQEMSSMSLLRGQTDVTMGAFGQHSVLHPSNDNGADMFSRDHRGRPVSPPPAAAVVTKAEQTHTFPDAPGVGISEGAGLLQGVDSDEEEEDPERSPAAAARSAHGVPMPYNQQTYAEVDLHK